MRKRLIFDMDGTLAKWNAVSDEQLFEKGYFENLEPNLNLVVAVNKLLAYEEEKEGIYILSSYLKDSAFALEEKNRWLDKYIPDIDKNHRLFVPYGMSKAEFFNEQGLSPIKENDFLVDDYTVNLNEWRKMGGTGIKFLNGINHSHKSWQGDFIHIDSKNILGELWKIQQEHQFTNRIQICQFEGNSVALNNVYKNYYLYNLDMGLSPQESFIIPYKNSDELVIISERDIFKDCLESGLDNDHLSYMDLAKIYDVCETIEDNRMIMNIEKEEEEEEEIE